jgi:hypothetical protein
MDLIQIIGSHSPPCCTTRLFTPYHTLMDYMGVENRDCSFLAQFHILSIGTRDVDRHAPSHCYSPTPKRQVVPVSPST